MRNNIRSTNLRFNLDKDLQRKAWQYLQTMDKSTFKSYSKNRGKTIYGARLSLKSDKWTDESGHTFLYYPVKSLAETLHKSEMTIKTSLAALEKADLIRRVKQGAGMPSRIYLKVPAERERKLSVGGTEYYHTEGQETVFRRDRKLSTIKNNGYKTKYQEKEYRDYSCRENESL